MVKWWFEAGEREEPFYLVIRKEKEELMKSKKRFKKNHDKEGKLYHSGIYEITLSPVKRTGPGELKTEDVKNIFNRVNLIVNTFVARERREFKVYRGCDTEGKKSAGTSKRGMNHTGKKNKG